MLFLDALLDFFNGTGTDSAILPFHNYKASLLFLIFTSIFLPFYMKVLLTYGYKIDCSRSYFFFAAFSFYCFALDGDIFDM
jgi:hypothetical protein